MNATPQFLPFNARAPRAIFGAVVSDFITDERRPGPRTGDPAGLRSILRAPLGGVWPNSRRSLIGPNAPTAKMMAAHRDMCDAQLAAVLGSA